MDDDERWLYIQVLWMIIFIGMFTRFNLNYMFPFLVAPFIIFALLRIACYFDKRSERKNEKSL